MDNFLGTIQPYILSEISFVQTFALRTINGALLGNEETFELALKANDMNPPVLGKNKVLPYTKNFRIGQKGMESLVDHIKKNDDNLIWYLSILSHCDPELIEAHYEEIKPFVVKNGQSPLKNLIQLNHISNEGLLEELSQVLHEMEEQQFYNGSLYNYAKAIIDRLIKKNGIASEEVIHTIRQELDKDFFSYKGILFVYIAGEMRLHTLVKDLSNLLTRTDEEILLEEIERTLIKIGSEEVVAHVTQHALNPNDYFSPITILGHIKSDHATKALLALIDQAPDMTAKTMIAAALCEQLSTEAIPKVEALIEEGYDQSLLSLEEAIYANCVINGVDHPKLQEWKDLIDERAARLNKREEEFNNGFNSIKNLNIKPKTSAASTKVGRNDPCPCGSGKKYKKCCGK